jgi:sulfatase modifying factor 1
MKNEPQNPVSGEHSSDAVKPRSCCAPRFDRDAAATPVLAAITPAPIASGTTADSKRSVISLPAATFLMGTDYAHGFPADGEGPVRPVALSSFDIDTYPVTNADFADFIAATNYRTEAELFGWSFVFWSHIPPERFESVVEDTAAHTPWWCKVPGASWNHPEGPGSSIDSRLNHPVVHVSWSDAAAYAAWAAKQLPTEAQWEYAARGGIEQKLYPWGDDLTPNGQHRCNIWQGQFPIEDVAADGFAGSCPVDAFPPNAYGLYSATGNVWEWCADWFHTAFTASPTLHEPTGPASGSSKVMKGGSFLCHASYCNRYRVAARTSNTPDSSASNIGFRCVRNRSDW